MIEISDIGFSYGNKSILDSVSFKISPGECVALLGNNGAGKSTLVTCLNKIKKAKKGKVLIAGKDALKMSRIETAKCISYVAQKTEISSMTVFDSILLGRKPYIKWTISQEDLDICEEIVKKLGLEDFRLRSISELSGGELQKVMLARALVQEPKLLLLDEPTSNLDPKNQYESLKTVRKFVKERNISSLIVIHDLNLALKYCDKFVFLKDGRVYRQGDASIVDGHTINEVYGIQSQVSDLDGRKVVIFEN